MEIIKNEVAVGAEKSFGLIHLTDIHLTHVGEGDIENLHRLAVKRSVKYSFSDGFLREAGTLAAEDSVFLITGDMMDYNTDENLARAREFVRDKDYIFVCGNHDFRPDGGMQFDVPESREKNLGRVNGIFGNDVRFFSRVINGVNIVGMDDCYYMFEEWQLERLKAEAAKGLPIILALHVPLYSQACYDLMITEKRRYASLVAVPEEKLGIYPPERYTQQKADDITQRTYDYIMSESLIKAVICGHVHKNFETELAPGKVQYITGTDTARVFEIK